MPVWLIGPVAKILGLILFVVAVFGYGYFKGSASVQQRWDAAIATQAVAASQTVIKQAKQTATIVTKYIQVKGEREVVTQTIEKEVVRYVDTPHPACVVPVEFERLWDTAAHHDLPAPAGATDGLAQNADSGLTLATVLSAGTDYAAAYYALRDQHAALAEWVQTTYANTP